MRKVITISGASCTGKTTLLNTIQATLGDSQSKKIHYHGEFIRKLFNEHYSNVYKDFEELLQGDPSDIIKLHKETARLFNEILWSSDSDDILIFDRCPIDISIYLYMHIADKMSADIIPQYTEASKYIYRCAEDFMNHNPILLYTRPFNNDVEEDGFRPSSLLERRSLELSLFDKEFLSLPNVHILPSALGERLKVVGTILTNSLR